MEVEPLPDEPRETALDKLLIELDRLVIDESVPGTKLPAEGELAIRFGVSRITVREALKVLAGRDLVDLGTGRRAVVKSPTSATLASHMDVMIRRNPQASLELNEIRAALEVQAATLAAQRSARADVIALELAVQRMTAAAASFSETGDESEYHQADIEFHEALARASGNQMLALLLTSLEDSLRSTFTQSFRGHVLLGKPLQAALDDHNKILDRVANGDARGAAAAMRATLHQSSRNLRAALANDHPAVP